MKQFLVAAFFGFTILVMGTVGCESLARHLAPPTTVVETVDAATGKTTSEVQQTGNSQAVSAVEAFKPALGPYGDVLLLGLMFIQNAYLGNKKRKQIANQKAKDRSDFQKVAEFAKIIPNVGTAEVQGKPTMNPPS